ncbi:MAG: fibronectin type III domain-containing protein, partial [Candidatus Methylacidiphilales bacterium]
MTFSLPKRLSKIFGGILLFGLMMAGANAATNSYSTAGASTFTVPANVTSIQITLTGAAGGSGGGDGSSSGGSGGPAGRVTGTLAVVPGDTLYINLGGAGSNGGSSVSNGGGGAGGANSGGRVSSASGGAAGGLGSSGGGGGGGGSAYVRRLSSGVFTDIAEAGGAGGGGGAGNTSPNQAGLSGTTGSYVLQYTGSAGTDRGSGNDGGGGGGGGTGKRGGAGGGLRTSGNTDSGGNGGNAGENDTTGLTSASASYVTVSAGAAASATLVYTALPSAPVISSATATDTTVTLSWSAPASGPAITDYIVKYLDPVSSNWVTFNDGISTSTSATVTGLNHNSIYAFQVAAVNADGTGAYSNPFDVTTLKNFLLTVSGGSSSYTLLGSAVAVDSALTIVDQTSGTNTAAKVQISSGFQEGDTLALPTGGAAAAFPGITGSYNATNGILTLSGSGTAAVYQAALRAITFSTTNTSTSARTIGITLGNAIAYGDHFYEVVTNSVTWPTARSGALAKSLFGIPGYLVNITSSA